MDSLHYDNSADDNDKFKTGDGEEKSVRGIDGMCMEGEIESAEREVCGCGFVGGWFTVVGMHMAKMVHTTVQRLGLVSPSPRAMSSQQQQQQPQPLFAQAQAAARLGSVAPCAPCFPGPKDNRRHARTPLVSASEGIGGRGGGDMGVGGWAACKRVQQRRGGSEMGKSILPSRVSGSARARQGWWVGCGV